MNKLLILEDDKPLAESLRENLSEFEVALAHTPSEGMETMKETNPCVVLLDLGFPDDVAVGLSTLTELLQVDPRAKIIVMTGFGSCDVGARAVERGAYAYIEKPIRDFQALRVILQQAFQIYALEGEIHNLRKESTCFSGIIGTSPAIERVYQQIREVASTNTTVLIQGMSGTGKELVARAIHESSGRQGPLVILDCTAIPQNLVEDKLFGHTKGAFTGAISEATGALEMADGGTLFIDEIGELPLFLQAKLLRFLQEKTFQRIGSHYDLSVDVRIVAATHRDLKAEVAARRFREDLYWRLNVYPIAVPPLRERPEDIPLLVSHFLKKYSDEYGKKITRVSPAALAKLSGYDWPGNVRELENLIQRAMLVASGAVLLPEHISPFETELKSVRLSDLEARWKGHWIREALARQGGRLQEAAADLGISKRQLQRYTKEFGIDWKKYLSALVLVIFLFSSSPVWSAPKKLSLNDLIEKAMESQLKLRIAKTRQEEAEGYRLKARAASLPHLNLELSYLRFHNNPSATLRSFQTDATIDMRPIKEEFPVLGAGPDQVTAPVGFADTNVDLMGENLLSTLLTFKQPIFSGGRIKEKRKQAKLGSEMADLNLTRTGRMIKAEVKERYFKWLFATRGLRHLSESAKRVVVVERFLKNLYENYVPKKGEEGLSRVDWLKAVVLESQILAKREEAKTHVSLAEEALKSYCGLNNDESVLLDEKIPKIVLPPLVSALKKVPSLPESRLAEGQVQMARSEVKFAKGARYPEIGAFGFFSYTADNFPSEPIMAGGGLNIRFPLFDGFERSGEIRRAKAFYQRAAFEADQVETDLTLAVKSLYVSTKELQKSLEYLKQASHRARERRELAAESYLLNFGKYEDYLDALKEEVETNGLLLAEQFKYWTQMAKLESLVK